MDFTFSDEQQALGEMLGSFLANEYPIGELAGRGDPAAQYADIFRALAELGLSTTLVPEACGGMRGNAGDFLLIMRELGRGFAVTPYASLIEASTLLLQGGTPEQRRDLLPALGTGEKVIVVAAREQGEAVDTIGARLVRTSGGYRLSGEKRITFGGSIASEFIVAARVEGDLADAGGITLCIVAADAKGVSRDLLATVDGDQAARLTFEDVFVPDAAIVGEVGGGRHLLDRAADEAIAATCAELVGLMGRMLELTGEYSRGRSQFGQSISQFQIIQHMIADMFVLAEQSTSMAYMAALSTDRDAVARARAVSAAMAYIGQSAVKLGHLAVQIHGGMGMTEEMPIGSLFRRCVALTHRFGGPDYHLARFASLG